MEDLFKALSEQSRLRIISLLMHGEMCVCEIECSLNLTQSNASRHLNALKRCGILEKYKQAQWTFYKINEHFKNEYEYLWQHLAMELPKMTSYDADLVAYQRCKRKGNCCQSNKPH